ncbi:gluconate transporter [Delftia sp. Cs1-4]|nr:gluconate transporter [Delftia sp. Cs1-4]
MPHAASAQARSKAKNHNSKLPMSSFDTQLLLIALASVLVLVALIVSRIRLHPLLALLVVSIGVGFATGMAPGEIVKNLTNGAGKTLGAVGVVIALGAMLGKILADSGTTERLASAILQRTSERMIPWAMTLVAFVIGIPMFFEVGLVVMLPLIFSVARKLESSERFKGSAYVYVGVPVIAALAAMHGMVPPHPGPLTAIATLHTTVGPTMLYGFLAVIPAMVLGGPLYGAFITPRMSTRPDAALLEQFTSGKKEGGEGSAPSIGMGVLCALLPALLMLVHALAEVLLPKDSGLLHAAAFLGNPLVAMLLGVVFASITLGYLRGADAEKLRDALGQSLKPIAGIMLIIAGGGAFQQILTSAKVGDAIVHMTQQFALPPLVLGWMIAMLLSVSTGSATVGIVGAAGLLAPLAASDPSLNVPLLALAIGCGSLFFNYANHAGFWMVKESFGMSMGEATKTITVVQSIVSFVGLLMVLLFNLLPKLG